MRMEFQFGAVALAVLFAIAVTVGAAAQTNSQMSPAGTAQGKINPDADQAQDFLKSLEDMVVQSVQGLQQSVGAKVPADVKTTPMPADAAATLPDAKDHHIVKPDDDTVLIVDPMTREIVSVITALEGASQQNTAAPAVSK